MSTDKKCPNCSEHILEDTVKCGHCKEIIAKKVDNCPECHGSRLQYIGSRSIRAFIALFVGIAITFFLSNNFPAYEVVGIIITLVLLVVLVNGNPFKCKDCDFSWAPKGEPAPLRDSKINDYAKPILFIFFIVIVLGSGYFASQLSQQSQTQTNLAQVSERLDVHRDEIISPFEDKGYEFIKGDNQFGFENYVGEKGEEYAIQLLGPEENIVQASIIMRVLVGEDGEEKVVSDNIADLDLFLSIITPEWEESSKWLAASLEEITEIGLISIQYDDDVAIMMQDTEDYDVIILTARPIE